MITFKIIWTVAFMMTSGPVYKDVPEPYTFKSKKECDTFGTKMVKRMEDWSRGVLSAAWETPIFVVWRCEPAGQPA